MSTIPVHAGDDLQAAFETAKPGDTLALDPGATFLGSFWLPPKSGNSQKPITVRSSATLDDRRIAPEDRALLPKIGSGSADPALDGPGSKHWRFDGIEFLPCKDAMDNVIYTHDGADDLTFDRVLIVGGDQGQKNAIAGNGGHITVTRCHFANIYQQGAESHGFVAWDGPGPFTLTDNYIEAASIGILFGGANSSSPDHVPSDILVEGNHITKRLDWKGQWRVVKNLFECKSARRVTVRDNLLEHNWPDAQNGYGVLFTTRNDDNGSPWAVVEDVVFSHNVIRDSLHGVNLLGINDGSPSGQTNNIRIEHNLWLLGGTFLQAGGEVGDISVCHNTIENRGDKLMVLYKGWVWPNTGGGRPAAYAIRHLTYKDNLGYHQTYGVFGDESTTRGAHDPEPRGVPKSAGQGALDLLTQGYDWTNDVLANRVNPYEYPPITVYPSTAEHEAQFTPEYTLVEGSAYRGKATDGSDLGWTGSAVIPPDPEPPDPEPGPEPEPVDIEADFAVSVARGDGSGYTIETKSAAEALAFLESYATEGAEVEARATATGEDAYALLKALGGETPD